MPSKKQKAKMKRKAIVDEMKRIKSKEECKKSQQHCFDEEYEETQMKALDNFLEKNKELTDESGYNKYCMRVMIQHTNLLGRNFQEYDCKFNPRGQLPKEIVDGLDNAGVRKTLGFWNIVNGDTKTIEYMYASYDDGAIMPIGKKTEDFPIKMEW